MKLLVSVLLSAGALVLPGVRATVGNVPHLNGPVFPVNNLQFGKTRTSDFVHPGIWHTHDDLERIRNNVANGTDPWASAFTAFAADSYSQANYTQQGPFAVVSRGAVNNYTALTADSRAAWQNALMWYVTRDAAHWERATTLLDAWGSNLTDVVGTDTSLLVGLEGALLANAAEIMRWEGGWVEAGAAWQGGTGFSAQLYWLFARQSIIVGQANYGMVSIKALLDFAVYLDDVTLWNYALNAFYHDPCAGLRANFDAATGQSAESGRDQGHVQGGIGWAALAARTVRSQGGDVYALANNTLLRASEYTAKFVLNETVAYDPRFYRCEAVLVNGPWREISQEGRAFNSPIYDIIYYEYVAKRGLEAPWTTKAKAGYGFEGHFTSADHPSWGDLIWAY